MGNDSSTYASCELGPYYETATLAPWTLHTGKCQDGSRVSVFVYETEEIPETIVDNAIKQLKTLKHPGIIKYVGAQKTRGEIWILTEPVRPLEAILDTLYAEEICAGLYSLIQVLNFLHEAGFCHNNVSLSSIFVGLDGSWKLGGLEWLCRFTEATQSHLASCRDWRVPSSIPPEEKGKGVSGSGGSYRDIYGFGNLGEQLLKQITSLGDLTKTFELRISDDCLNPSPELRPPLSSLLDDRIFKCDYVDIVQFLKNLTVQQEAEKQTFFSGLVKRLYQLPVSLVASRLARPLLARFVLLESAAEEYLLPHILTPAPDPERVRGYKDGEINPLLPETVFVKYLVPELFKIFQVRDAHIRIILLRHFSKYVNQFEEKLLKASVLPQILLGVRDSNDELASLSLHALANLVHILGGDIVIGGQRARIFTMGNPKAIDSSKLCNGKDTFQKSPSKAGKLSPTKRPSNPELEKKRQEAKKAMEERKRKRQEQKRKQAEKAKLQTLSIESDDGGPADLKRSDSTDKQHTTGHVTQGDDHVTPHQTGHMTQDETQTGGMTQAETNDVEVDWSDVWTEPKPHTEVFNPATAKTRTSPPPVSSNTLQGEGRRDSDSAESGDEWRAGWEPNESAEWMSTKYPDDQWQDSNTQPSTQPSIQPSTQPSILPSTEHKKQHSASRTSKQANSKKLGEEFDIMALDIKSISVSTAEVDYFADMVPDIKPKANSLMSAMAISDPVSGEKKKAAHSVSFAVDNTDEVEEGGWDVDW